jgi:hypothetical protein
MQLAGHKVGAEMSLAVRLSASVQLCGMEGRRPGLTVGSGKPIV